MEGNTNCYCYFDCHRNHYTDVIMGAMASQITSLMIVYSTFYLGVDQRKYQSCASLAFVRGIHRSPVNSPHKCPVTRKLFPFEDVIMYRCIVVVFVAVFVFILIVVTTGIIFIIVNMIIDKNIKNKYFKTISTFREYSQCSCLSFRNLPWPYVPQWQHMIP